MMIIAIVLLASLISFNAAFQSPASPSIANLPADNNERSNSLSKTDLAVKVLKSDATIESITDRRTALLNMILTSGAVTASSAASFPISARAFSLGGGGSSSSEKKEIKPTTAYDIAGNPIIAQKFLSKKKFGDRTMVQGIKGDPTYLIVTAGAGAGADQDQLQIGSYALNAECTHLGCVVPWDPMLGKFVCPCHGSQYDREGSVLRGPAPGSLKLAKVDIEEESGKVMLEPWVVDDFRTGNKPWWIS